jgi:hypothetical protein
MNAAYLHVLLNHFPVMGALFGFFFLIAATLSGNKTLKISALVIFVATGLLTIPTFLTGEGAEEVVENLSHVSKQLIYQHEEFAEKAVWFVYLTAILSAAQLFLIKKNKIIPAWINSIFYVLVILCLLSMGWTNKLGGKISHSEFRSD